MIPEAYKDIVAGLYQKTKENQVVWRETSYGKGFVVFFTDFALTLDSLNNDNNAATYCVYLIDNNGNNLDSFEIIKTDMDWSMMNELYAIARRKVHRVDDALAAIKSEISGNNIVGHATPRLAVSF